ncbi:MAG TPA: hypothetical protein IAD15_03355 [Candidatus Fimiplasma intestinipullorum]|uniref:Uncharacterized protein n=1 Tax=Candidatus Fimiplasma intestinipullorum TaxID=2840825 RepID=A0A9D1HM73_9FIRM|nr:hypothetical protein [Candidatus Fimiplasma intestinipullorum]
MKSKGVSNRGVAEKTGYTRSTVNKIIKQINEAGSTDDEVRNLNDQMLNEHFNALLPVGAIKIISCPILSC